MNDEVIVKCDDLSFAYGSELALDNVSIEFKAGEFVAITGPNGGGKSTLFEIILGLRRPASGRVEILGTPPQQFRERWRIGYVPQRPYAPGDFPATVLETVSTGRWARLGPFRLPRERDREAIDRAIAITGIGELKRQRVGELSGGQQQRVHLARALASTPDVLFLDEPMVGVDFDAQMHFCDVLSTLNRESGLTVILIAHEYGPLAELVQRLVVLAGTIRYDGQPPRHDHTDHHHYGLGAEYLSLWDESGTRRSMPRGGTFEDRQ